jgi:hypothetical protein
LLYDGTKSIACHIRERHDVTAAVLSAVKIRQSLPKAPEFATGTTRIDEMWRLAFAVSQLRHGSAEGDASFRRA